jgi:hypothetical protein
MILPGNDPIVMTYLKRSFVGAPGTTDDSGISPFQASLIAGMTLSMDSCETCVLWHSNDRRPALKSASVNGTLAVNRSA